MCPMQSAPLPPDENARLAALDESGLVFTPAEERFDRLTRLAAKLFGTPMVAISLVDQDLQWFKSSVGLDVAQTPRSVSFCAHALESGELVVENALDDPRFADNPIVTGEPHIRAYAGKTIRSASGHALGTFCIMDSKPRTFAADELQLLEDLSAIVQGELRHAVEPDSATAFMQGMHRWARERALDAVTRCWNHDAMVELLMRQHASATATGATFAVALLGLERFQPIQRDLGSRVADQVLAEVATTMRRVIGESAALGRYDTDTFLLVMPRCEEREAQVLTDHIVRAVSGAGIRAGPLSLHVGLTVGLASWQAGMGVVQLVEVAVDALRRARAGGEA